MQVGASLLLFSRAPKVALGDCDGSQLVMDAKAVFAQPWSEEEQSVILDRVGALERQASYFQFSGGLPGLCDALLSVPRSGMQEAERRALAAEALRERIALAVSELGWRVAVALEDKLAREQSIEVDSARDDPLIVEALRGSGLLVMGDDGRGVLLSDRVRAHLTEGVRSALDGVVDAPGDVKEVLAGLWEIERRIRAIVGRQARKQHGKGWRASLLDPDLERRVMERVEKDASLPVASISQVPNPLDWLTLDELLDLFADSRLPMPNRLPSAFWRLARQELVPVRNRAAHVRLPALHDAETVRRWRGQIELRGGVSTA